MIVSQPGGPDVLRPGEADVPRPGPGEVLVRVVAAGVGPWDAWLRAGGWDGVLPYIPGGEFAGLVERESGDAAGLHGGAPVYGYPGLTGCYAQFVTSPGAPLDAACEAVTEALCGHREDDVTLLLARIRA